MNTPMVTTVTREVCYESAELRGPLFCPVSSSRTIIRSASGPTHPKAFPGPPLDAPIELASPAGSHSASSIPFLWVSPSCSWHSLTVYLCLQYGVTMGTPNCYSVDLQYVPKGPCVEVLVPSLWHYRELTVALTCGVFSRWNLSRWGMSLEVIMGHRHFSLLSLLSGPSFHVLCYYRPSDYGMITLPLS